jgi:DNA-binding transcriptional LysR family regulator
MINTDPELRHLRAFVVLAEELHFRRAAARLGVQQPALSQHIRLLELSVGARLLERTTRRVGLTPAGEVFVQHARRTIDHLEQSVAAARRAARGELGVVRLGFSASASIGLFPAILRCLHERLPEVQVEVYEQPLWSPVESVTSDLLDLVFVRGPVTDPTVTAVTIAAESMMVVAPQGHPLLENSVVTPRMLAGEPFVLFRRAYAPELHDLITGLCGQEGFSPRVVREAGEWPIIASLVSAGFGISVAPESARSALIGGIGARPLAGTEGAGQLCLVHAPGLRAPAVRQVVQTLVSEARRGLFENRD